MAGNERVTEAIVREQLARLQYVAPILVEEQRSAVAGVRRLLANASKRGTGKTGQPEFIVTSPDDPDVVLVMECKADQAQHVSVGVDSQPAEYAVDGALHYARHLSKEYHVLAVAVSGTDRRSLKVSTFLWPKEAPDYRELLSLTGEPVSEILPWADYMHLSTYDPEVKRKRIEEVLALSRQMHDFMRDYAKLTEAEKPLLVAGTLIALMNRQFRQVYSTYTAAALQTAWYEAIQKQLEAADLPQAKWLSVTQPYSSIAVHPELGKATTLHPAGPLYELIKTLDEQVFPLMEVYKDHDVVGAFYGEFLKYTGGDKKSLGIVLTPRHVTELFCRLAEVTKDDVVIDICCGTGGFLISAMAQMLDQAMTEGERTTVKQQHLIGIENQPNMYALAASNMLLRGDGKANLYQGSCFDLAPGLGAEHHPTVGLINPPYHQKGEGQQEMDFVLAMLDCLEEGGRGVAIVPVSCATGSYLKEAILRRHRLEAVMSMPPELFYPVSVVTCIMVFTAHKPHAATPDRQTWFGYWRDDGFTKTKHKGRVDLYDEWPIIEAGWVDGFINRRTAPGQSVTRRVTAQDEWTAEAYMDTDYSALGRADFARVVRAYALHTLNLQEWSDAAS